MVDDPSRRQPKYGPPLNLPPKNGKHIQIMHLRVVVASFGGLSAEDSLVARLHANVFPFVSRTVREELIKIVEDPVFSGIPHSRQGLTNAKERIMKELKIPQLRGKKVKWKDNGVTFSDTEGEKLTTYVLTIQGS